jgi:hypothetical protein
MMATDNDDLSRMLEQSAEIARERQERFGPITGIYVSNEGKAIDISLDTSQDTYSEWIEGEGGDISLTRRMDTNKVAGAHLPCYAKTLVIGGSNFPTIRIDLASGEVVIEPRERGE